MATEVNEVNSEIIAEIQTNGEQNFKNKSENDTSKFQDPSESQLVIKGSIEGENEAALYSRGDTTTATPAPEADIAGTTAGQQIDQAAESSCGESMPAAAMTEELLNDAQEDAGLYQQGEQLEGDLTGMMSEHQQYEHQMAMVNQPQQHVDGYRPPRPEDNDKKLFVGGLTWDTNTMQIREYFEQFGEIENVDLKMDMEGQSRGFAFVTFYDSVSIGKVTDCTEHILNAKQIDPKPANPRGGRTPNQKEPMKKVFVGGVSPEMEEAIVREHFEQFGPVAEVERPRGPTKKKYCFVTFETEDAAKLAIVESKQTIGDVECDVNKATPKAEYPRTGYYDHRYYEEGYAGYGYGYGYGPRGRGRGRGRGGYPYGYDDYYNQGYDYGNYGNYDYGNYDYNYGNYDYNSYYGYDANYYNNYGNYYDPSGYDWSNYYQQGYDYSSYYGQDGNQQSQGGNGGQVEQSGGQQSYDGASVTAGKPKRGASGATTASAAYHPYQRKQ